MRPAWPDPTQSWSDKLVLLVFCSNHSKILDSRCMSCEPTLLRWPCYSHLQSFTGSIIVVIRAASTAAAAAAQPQAPAPLWAIFKNFMRKIPIFGNQNWKNLRLILIKMVNQKFLQNYCDLWLLEPWLLLVILWDFWQFISLKLFPVFENKP